MSSGICLKLVSFFRAALMSCSSLVSLRAVYRDCLVRVEHCSVTVTMGFASGEPHTAITASPMLRVSKRLTANVFHESGVQAPAQLMPSTRSSPPPTAAKSPHRPLPRPQQRLQRRPRSEHQPSPRQQTRFLRATERMKRSAAARTHEQRISRP
jgi:hypothetical protein